MKDLFDAITERDKAIEKVTANASEEYKDMLICAVYRVLDKFDQFTADDVWAEAEHVKGFSSDPRALGGILSQFKKSGTIEPMGVYKPSVRRHAAPIMIWRKK